jgi:c-di-GMP-binding flagellar brake protein YcgR
MLESMSERRNFQRVPFATEAEIFCSGKKYLAELLDISLLGALVHCKSLIPLAEGSRCELAIHLMDSEVTLQFEVDIIHCRGNRVGFKFISEDTETAVHLRRLLELNIGSSEALEREVSLLLKDKHLR